MKRKRVLLFGSFDVGEGYPRARSLMQGLEAWDVEVFELNRALLPARGTRLRTASSPHRWPGAALRIWKGGVQLRWELRRLLKRERIDAVLVPYPGHFAVRWARSIFDGPVLLDMFLSLNDTLVSDRRLFEKGGLMAGLLRRIDRWACKSADLVLLDTPGHANFVAELTGLPPSHFSFVPVGDPDAPQTAFPFPDIGPDGRLKLLYLGTGVPLHGIETIISACARTSRVHLTFVGGTAEHRRAVRALGEDKVTVVEDWVGRKNVHRLLAAHHVVLGVFGTSDKVDRVIPFKLVHSLSAGRPAVTADTSAVNTLLDPGWDCYTCPAGNPAALARALRSMVREPHLLPRIGWQARKSYERMFSPEALGRKLLILLERVTGSAWLPEHADEAVQSPEETGAAQPGSRHGGKVGTSS